MVRTLPLLSGLIVGWFLSQPSPAKPAPVIRQVITTKKVLALTFDDGPSRTWTPKVLAVLNHDHVKATFFIVGSHATKRPDLIRAEIKDGMNIGSHGTEHLLLRNKSADVIRQEVQTNAQILESLGSPKPTLYRMPGGIADSTALKTLGQMGYTVIGWSIDTRDWRHRNTADTMAKMVEQQASPGAIVIFHDGPNGSEATVGAVKMLIPALKRQGYQFVTVQQMLKLEHRPRI